MSYSGFVLSALTVMLSLFVFDIATAGAQQISYWSAQEKIPAYEIYNNEQPPYLIADADHKVHAFNSQFVGENDSADSLRAVFYRQWTLSRGWTYPNDIFADIDGSIYLLGVSNDESGIVHLIFQKNFQDVYYSHAYLANASDPESWSAPISIGGGSLNVRFGIPTVAAISNDKNGERIIVVYSGTEFGNGLYFTYSNDHGDTWSLPYPIYLTGDETFVVTNPSLYMGQSGVLHAVWATFDSKGFGGPGYYARFDLDSGIWSEPMELDVPGIRTPSVVEYNEGVFIGYYHNSSNGRWWRYSNDGGKTWTDPTPLSSRHVGTNGGVSFVVDSNETLHAFFAGRIDENATHGMWHSIWLGTAWSSADPVVAGKSISDIDGGNGFDPTFANATVSNGNVILVTWGSDGSAGTNGAWYSYTVLDAPELPGIPLPVPTVLPVNDLTSKSGLMTTKVPTPPAGIPDTLKDQKGISIRNPQTQIFVALIPVAFLLIGSFIAKVIRTRSG